MFKLYPALDDNTVIGSSTWASIKDSALEDDFKESSTFMSYSAEEKDLIDALIESHNRYISGHSIPHTPTDELGQEILYKIGQARDIVMK